MVGFGCAVFLLFVWHGCNRIGVSMQRAMIVGNAIRLCGLPCTAETSAGDTCGKDWRFPAAFGQKFPAKVNRNSGQKYIAALGKSV